MSWNEWIHCWCQQKAFVPSVTGRPESGPHPQNFAGEQSAIQKQTKEQRRNQFKNLCLRISIEKLYTNPSRPVMLINTCAIIEQSVGLHVSQNNMCHLKGDSPTQKGH